MTIEDLTCRAARALGLPRHDASPIFAAVLDGVLGEQDRCLTLVLNFCAGRLSPQDLDQLGRALALEPEAPPADAASGTAAPAPRGRRLLYRGAQTGYHGGQR